MTRHFHAVWCSYPSILTDLHFAYSPVHYCLDIIELAPSEEIDAPSLYRESQKTRWLERAIEELKHSKNWVLPALKQIRDICCLYQESPPNLAAGPGQRTPGVLYRHEVINKLQTSHALVILVADNLTNYMDEVRQSPRKILDSDPLDYFPDGRYNHLQQVRNLGKAF